jgi:hypothetical protein
MDSKKNNKKTEKDLIKKKPVAKAELVEENDNETNEVPTVEGRRFKNVKTFQEMVEEGFSSPLTQYRVKAKSEIKDKVSSITNNDSKPAEKPSVPAPKKSFMSKVKDIVKPTEAAKPDRGNISALKSEISNKMKELDTMFVNNTENVATQAQEVKQLLEKLNNLLGKL